MPIMNPAEFEARLHPERGRKDDVRTEYERDKARIIHSAGFRRLQGKTQVMGVGEGDFHRTRLTHSIETGQIGEGILLKLQNRHANDPEILSGLPDRALVDAACCAHDLGHPPYGHGGEPALQEPVDRRDPFAGARLSARFCRTASELGRQLDRGDTHVHILELNGESYRLKQSKARRRCATQPADEAAPAADPETGEITTAF
jgi:predicted deoxyguanosinetriphosphate triphosphohydrolase